MDGHQRHQVLGGRPQACQAGVLEGAIEHQPLRRLLIPGAVGEDQVVCWWGRVTPCDVHTGGCQLGEVQLRDGPDPCKPERGGSAHAVCSFQPPGCT